MQKGEISERISSSLLARRVYLMNIPYDTYPHEIEDLCKTFVEIENVVIPRNHEGLTRGFAFVYLKDPKDVQLLIEYVDGRHIR